MVIREYKHVLDKYLDKVIDNENYDDDAASDDDDEEEDILKRTLFSVYFILFEIFSQFRWLLGNNI